MRPNQNGAPRFEGVGVQVETAAGSVRRPARSGLGAERPEGRRDVTAPGTCPRERIGAARRSHAIFAPSKPVREDRARRGRSGERGTATGGPDGAQAREARRAPVGPLVLVPYLDEILSRLMGKYPQRRCA